MMETSSSIAGPLVEVADSHSAIATGFQLHIFGSATKTPGPHSDTDVLILYPSGHLDEAHQFATALRRLELFPPLDVIALSYEEERELDFIAFVKAKKFWECSNQAR